jgi:hypothetical protein
MASACAALSAAQRQLVKTLAVHELERKGVPESIIIKLSLAVECTYKVGQQALLWQSTVCCGCSSLAAKILPSDSCSNASAATAVAAVHVILTAVTSLFAAAVALGHLTLTAVALTVLLLLQRPLLQDNSGALRTFSVGVDTGNNCCATSTVAPIRWAELRLHSTYLASLNQRALKVRAKSQ